jgi:hypothetical protein
MDIQTFTKTPHRQGVYVLGRVYVCRLSNTYLKFDRWTVDTAPTHPTATETYKLRPENERTTADRYYL